MEGAKHQMTSTKYQINLNAQNSNFPLILILSFLGRGWGEGGGHRVSERAEVL